jgi:hypothetical protein
MNHLKITVPRADLFFTCWALLAHVLSLSGIFYNTVGLAIFVCIGAEVINITINEEFNLTYHIVAHYIPLMILLAVLPFKFDVRPIIILIVLYAIYLRFDFPAILKYYNRPSTYAFQKPYNIILY